MQKEKSTLHVRITTGLVFGAVMLSSLIVSSYTAFVLFGIIAIVMTFEFVNIVGIKNYIPLVISFILGVGPYVLNFFNLVEFRPHSGVITISLIYGVLILFGLYLKKDLLQYESLGFMHVFLYIGIPFYLLAQILFSNDYTPNLIISIFALIWICDSSAYMVGSKIGRRKLFPRISPNKTWEGSLAAGIFTLLGAVAIYMILKDHDLIFYLIFGLIIWIFGTFGDLVESHLKRKFDIKDSGTIMPGHGGFLDRFDSFIFVIPFVSALLYFYH